MYCDPSPATVVDLTKSVSLMPIDARAKGHASQFFKRHDWIGYAGVPRNPTEYITVSWQNNVLYYLQKSMI